MITLGGIVLLFLGLIVFLLPSILSKGKVQQEKVALVNVFWGSTGIGWLLSLVWAFFDLEKINKKLAVRWLGAMAGFIFLLIWDFKTHRHRAFIDFSYFQHLPDSTLEIISLKWLPMSLQFVLVMGVGFFLARTKDAFLLAMAMALILFSLNFIKPAALSYCLLLWGSLLFYSLAVKS